MFPLQHAPTKRNILYSVRKSDETLRRFRPIRHCASPKFAESRRPSFPAIKAYQICIPVIAASRYTRKQRAIPNNKGFFTPDAARRGTSRRRNAP